MKGRFCCLLVVTTPLVGVAHAKETVLVVGAGFAGLTAASDLASSGYDVVVLEARDRIGGRAYTDRSTDINLDMGCSWIIGTEQNEA